LFAYVVIIGTIFLQLDHTKKHTIVLAMKTQSKKTAASSNGRAAGSASRAGSDSTSRTAVSKNRSNGSNGNGNGNGKSNGNGKKASSNGSGEKESLRGSQLGQYFLDELKDVYWAEKHLLKALAKMAKAATTEELKQAFLEHRNETEDHVSRLEEVFEMIGEKAVAKKCDAIEGITKEVESAIEDTHEDSYTRDVALIIGGQKAEHYEIATYGGLAQLAMVLGHDDAAELLLQTLDEEKAADSTLTSIAENSINEIALTEQE
jgi:ferritin-like metal-binding protein YciE